MTGPLLSGTAAGLAEVHCFSWKQEVVECVGERLRVWQVSTLMHDQS